MKEEQKKPSQQKQKVSFNVDKAKLLAVAGPKVTWQDNSCTSI